MSLGKVTLLDEIDTIFIYGFPDRFEHSMNSSRVSILMLYEIKINVNSIETSYSFVSRLKLLITSDTSGPCLHSPNNANNTDYVLYEYNNISLAVYTCKDGFMWADETRTRSIVCLGERWSSQVNDCIRKSLY